MPLSSQREGEAKLTSKHVCQTTGQSVSLLVNKYVNQLISRGLTCYQYALHLINKIIKHIDQLESQRAIQSVSVGISLLSSQSLSQSACQPMTFMYSTN